MRTKNAPPCRKVKEQFDKERLYSKEILLEHWKEICQDFDKGLSYGELGRKYDLPYGRVRNFFVNSTTYQIWKQRKDKEQCLHCKMKEGKKQ